MLSAVLSSLQRRAFAWIALAALAVVSSLALTKNIDFRVYWFALHGFFDGSRLPYGPTSGLGFPMHYRYSPVTYLVLWPLRFGPLYWDGVLWMFGIWTVSIAVTRLAIRRLQLQFSPLALVALLAFLLSYAVLTLRSGNIQPYLIAMIFAALLLSETRPRVAGCLMALAITFKIWPLFFLPWFFRVNRRAALKWILPALLFLWLCPLLVWSPAHYGELIREWFENEFQAASGDSEIWYFPGQSLRGIVLRYFTTLPAAIPDFPDIHFLSIAPRLAVIFWKATAVCTYLWSCFVMLRSDRSQNAVWDGYAFALFTVLEPFCLKSSMISLAPAALIAASFASRPVTDGLGRRARWLFFGACGLSFATAVLQSKALVHLLLAVGVDFWAVILLLSALFLWRRPQGRSINP